MARTLSARNVDFPWLALRRTANFLGVSIGIAAGLGTVGFGIYSLSAFTFSPDAQVSLLYLMVLSGVLLLTQYFLFYRIFKYAKKEKSLIKHNKKLESEISDFGNDIQFYRKYYYYMSIRMRKIAQVHSDFVLNLDNYMSSKSARQHAEEAISLIVDDLLEMMDYHTSDRCSVSIKMLNEHHRGNASNPSIQLSPDCVWTHLRAGPTHIERSSAERGSKNYPHHYEDHTPFAEIMKSFSDKDYWYENDLMELAKSGRYINPNPSWKRYYRAAAIGAIKWPNSKFGGNIIGFLCVDNRIGGFDDAFSKEAILTVANILGFLYHNLGEATEDRDDRPEPASWPPRDDRLQIS